MPAHPRRSLALSLLLALPLLQVSPATAEAMPPLQVDASLLKGAAPAKRVATTRPPLEAVRPITAMPLPAPREATAELKPAVALARKPGAQEHFVQLGAFSTQANAEARLRQVASELGPMASKLLIRPGTKLFLLQLGPWADAAAARGVRQQLRERHNIAAVYVAPPASDAASGVGSMASSSAETKSMSSVAGGLRPNSKR